MTVLVTGATGFVGSAVARRLVEAGHRVRVLVRASSDPRNLQGLDCDQVIGDLTDKPSLAAAVTDCDAVFHVAADYRLWAPDPAPLYRINVDGTRALMLAALAAGVPRIVHTSSVATLGLNKDGSPANEETPVSLDDMIGPYKRSKYLAEQEVLRLVASDGLPAVIVNPAAPMGPRDIKPTPTGAMIVKAASGQMPAYVKTGLNVVHVDDVADGHLLAYERGAIGERYILGGENMALREILTEVARLSGRPPPRICLPCGPLLPIAYVFEAVCRLRGRGEPLMSVDEIRMARKLMYFSSDKAKRDLGYRPRPAREAIGDAVAWYRANGFLNGR